MDQEISFSALGDNSGQERPIVIEAEVEGHLIHRMSPSPYNGIIGRPCLRKIQAVPSTAHGMLKFPMKGGIVTIRSKTIILAECRMVTKAHDVCPPKEPAVTDGVKVAIHREYPDQTVMIGGSLSEKGRMELCNLLKENLDVFAWKPADMTGVPCFIAGTRLIIVRMTNLIYLKPSHGKEAWWQLDCYPLPEIDWKVESLCGYPFKCFLDAYKGYHQIQMAEEDEEKRLSTPTKESSATQKCRPASRTLEQHTSDS
ncbi:hypothetical protein Tco_0803791 [Tanacetum coccineum]|uniref:Reverse transcriptase domain-containing protein n=1 Tax=Tanacetum coccineum TaxID=301880 RepID=A0ABQ5A489_9ASTR